MAERERNETPAYRQLRDTRVAAIARAQGGVVSAEQLHVAGIDDNAIARRVDSGRWHAVFHGVYAVGHTALTRDAWFLGATLSIGDDSGLGFYSACQHYEVWKGQVKTVHVVVPRRVRPQERIHPHSVQSAPRWLEVRGVRVVLRGGPAATRNGGEDVALDLIRSCGLDPLVNHPLLGFVADFHLPEHRLVIEFDGRVHDIPIVRDADHRRQAIFEAAGLRVIRLRWRDVTVLRDQTRARILAATVTKLADTAS